MIPRSRVAGQRASGLKNVFLILLGAMLLSGSASAQDSKENADFKLAVNLFNDGLYELAVEQFRQFVGSYPSTAQGTEARFYLGQAQMRLGRLEEARLTFQTFALTYQDNPKAPEAWSNVGEIYAGQGNHREAALAYERVKVFHPRSAMAPDALVRAGREFRLAGMPDDARRVLRIVLQEYPASGATHSARTALAELYFQEGQVAQARNELLRVIDGDPSQEARAQALLILGDIYRAQWLPDDARGRYDEVIQKHGSSPAAPTAYLHRGELQNSTGLYADAASSFRKVLDGKASSDTTLRRAAQIGLGVAYEGQGEHAKAVRQFESVPGSGDDAELLWLTARAASGGSDYQKADEAGKRILAGKPDDALTRKTIALLADNALAAGDYNEALRTYARFMEEFPGDPATPAALLRGATVAREKLRDLRRSVLSCEVIISRFPRTPEAVEAHVIASEVYEQLGDFPRAIELRRALLEHYPATEEASQAPKKILELETFEAKNKDAALERLALLIGDVASGQQQQDISFRLGQTYFEDLKNYQAAAEQFTRVINSAATGPHFEESLLYRARSYEYLSWRDTSFRPRAIESYTTYLNTYKTSPGTDDAAYALFLLLASSPAEARQAYASVTALVPNTSHKASMLLETGRLEQRADSLASALRSFDRILREYPSSEAAGEAQFGRFHILLTKAAVDSALAEGERYLRKNPEGTHSAEVGYRLGMAALERGDTERAVKFLTPITNRFEYTRYARGARMGLARALTLQGSFDRAIALYDRLLKEDRANPFRSETDGQLLLAAADAYRRGGRSEQARAMLFEIVGEGEGRGEAFAALGMLANEEGDPVLATAYYKLASATNPQAAATREVADLMFSSGSYPDAVEKYRALAGTDAPEVDIRYYRKQLIISLIRAGEIESAGKEITAFSGKYTKTDPEMASFEIEKGNYYFRKENYKRAQESYAIVMKKYDDTPFMPDAMYWNGKTVEAQGNTKDAAKQYENLLDDYPSAPIAMRAHLALGNLAYMAEAWDKSVQHYRAVIENPAADDELLPFAMSNLIETYEAAGVNDAALDLARRYLDRYPNNEDSFDKKIKIGILYQRLGYYDQSIVHLQGLLDQAGSDLEGEIRYYIAEANFYKGDFQQAILDFLKVPYLVTKKGKLDWTANSLYMAGQSYERLGRYDQAVSMYKQIVDRSGIDETFKSAAKKEIDRVNLVIKGTK